VVDERNTIMGRLWNNSERDKPTYLDKRMSQCQRSITDGHGVEPGPPKWEVSD